MSRHRVADKLSKLANKMEIDLPITVHAWDGSRAGPSTGPTLILSDKTAFRRILRHPNELGIAEAYLAGEIDVEGNFTEAVSALTGVIRQVRKRGHIYLISSAFRTAILALRIGGIGGLSPSGVPKTKPRSVQHSHKRAQAAIAYHYDLSNEFFELVLDPSMAYSSAHWGSAGDNYTLADAQRDKLEQVCQGLKLQPGMHVLDIGCGWGALAIYAARQYAVHVTAVTLSRQQFEYVKSKVVSENLTSLIDVKLQDYRHITPVTYGAIAVIEMAEHVAKANYTKFVRDIAGLLKPGGMLFMQQLSRSYRFPGGGRFAETYIASDVYMRSLSKNLAAFENVGLEIHSVVSLREDYALTLRAWMSNLESHWVEVVDLIGERRARVWKLYFAGGALAFLNGRMGVEQICASKR